MTKRPLLATFIAYLSIIIGTISLIGILVTLVTNHFLKDAMPLLIVTLSYSLLFIISGYFILQNKLLGWQLGIFNQLLSVTRSYGALIYIFINISRINFDTTHTSDYLFKYAIQALISMGLVYYFLNSKTLKFFKAEGTIKVKTLQKSVSISISIIMIQMITHTISL